MARSMTLAGTDPVPSWARYAVIFCHGHTLVARPIEDAIQVFSSRRACEAFALAASHHFPQRTGDDLTIWALVYALPARREGNGYWGVHTGQCYLAIDPGAVVIKRHEIQSEYGYTAPKPRDQRCACCGVAS